MDGLKSYSHLTLHNYGSKHICCWLSDSHGASGLQVDSLTVWRRNSDDKKKRGTHISSTVVARRTVRRGGGTLVYT